MLGNLKGIGLNPRSKRFCANSSVSVMKMLVEQSENNVVTEGAYLGESYNKRIYFF